MLVDEFVHRIPKKGKIISDVQDKDSIDFSELIKKITSVTSYFSIISHSKKDKAVLFLENSIDYIILLLALFDLDIIIVPLNPRLNEEKTAYLLKHSHSSIFITSQEILNRNIWIRKLNCRVILTKEVFGSPLTSTKTFNLRRGGRSSNTDLKFIIYTSGTIGNPKGVMLSKQALKSKVSCLINILGFKSSAHFFSFLPFFSAHGMIPGMLAPLLSGCRIFISRFDPILAFNFWELTKKYEIDYFTSVPSILALLKKNIGDIQKGKIRYPHDIYCASSPLPQALYDWYSDYLGIKVHNCYGLTEVASWVSINLNDSIKEKSNCVGKAFCADIGVFDKRGNRLNRNEIGEFYIKSASNMSGYYKNKKESNLSITPDGFIKTGDLGYIDTNKKIFILDRIKHIIIRNGINVYPSEIDQVFLKHPGVKDSISFGVPDERYGERVITALIVSEKEKIKDKYFRYAIDKLPNFLIPNDFFFPKVFPRGPTGKVIVNSLREQYLKER